MSTILELKQAVQQLEVDIVDRSNAEREDSNWRDHDAHRSDGSGAQDARHEEIGRNTRERLLQAERKVKLQKEVIATILSTV
jgi:hypothetical protein